MERRQGLEDGVRETEKLVRTHRLHRGLASCVSFLCSSPASHTGPCSEFCGPCCPLVSFDSYDGWATVNVMWDKGGWMTIDVECHAAEGKGFGVVEERARLEERV